MEKLILDKLEKIDNTLTDIKVNLKKTDTLVEFHEEKIRNLETKLTSLEKGKLKFIYFVLSAIVTAIIALEIRRVFP